MKLELKIFDYRIEKKYMFHINIENPSSFKCIECGFVFLREVH